MIYSYFCSQCQNYEDVIKESILVDRQEYCQTCGKTMSRIFTAPNIKIVKSDYFHSGLGQYINTSMDEKNAMAEYRDRNGSELIEVGNEAVETSKPEEYQFKHNEIKDMHEILQSFPE